MSDYTLYCTTEQVKKALELGAPILDNGENPNVPVMLYNRKGYVIPTAEQMLGWLEEQGIFVEVSKSFIADYQSLVHDANTNVFYDEYFLSRKEATLAAINVALEYLTEAREAS